MRRSCRRSTTTSGPKTLMSDPIAVPRWRPISSSAGCSLATRSWPSRPGRARSGRPVGRRRSSTPRVAATGARALAGLAVLDDDDVPELGPAAVEPAADHDPAADARAEREQDQVVGAAPGAERELGEGGGARVVVDADRKAEPFAASRSRKSRSCSGMFTGAEDRARALVDTRRDAEPDRATMSGVLQLPHDLVERRRAAPPATRRRRPLDRPPHAAVRRRRGPRGSSSRRGRLRSRALPAKAVGTLLRRMAPEEKPYRVYKGGRVKGKVPADAAAPARARDARPAPRRAGRRPRSRSAADGARGRPSLAARDRDRRRSCCSCSSSLGRRELSRRPQRRRRREQAPRRPDARRARASRTGCCSRTRRRSCCSAPTTRGRAGRAATGTPTRSCSSAPTRRTTGIAYLSIPRDLRVADPRPRRRQDQRRLPARRRAARDPDDPPVHGRDINHVVIVDFDKFQDLIDARRRGRRSTCPAPILSNRFDCPYKTRQRCQQWKGWRFEKGRQHMDGRRALIYSRIRENRLNPRETDFTRARAPAGT